MIRSAQEPDRYLVYQYTRDGLRRIGDVLADDPEEATAAALKRYGCHPAATMILELADYAPEAHDPRR